MPSIVYIDFLDYYTLERARRSRTPHRCVVTEGNRAFRLATLLADNVVFPASSFFESVVCRTILRKNALFTDIGLVSLAASESSLAEHREAKLRQYDQSSPGEIVAGYRSKRRQSVPMYLQRSGSSVLDIRKNWLTVPQSDRLPQLLLNSVESESLQAIAAVWPLIPERLEGRAFITEHVSGLFEREKLAVPDRVISPIVESSYIQGYLRAFRAALVGDLVYLRTQPRPRRAPEAFSYAIACQRLVALGLLELIDFAPADHLVELKLTQEWDVLKAWLLSEHGRLDNQILRAADGATVAARGMRRLRTVAVAGLRPKDLEDRGDEPTRIGVITALTEEFVAAKYMIEDTASIVVPDDNNVYVEGYVPSNYQAGHRHKVVLTQLKRMGTNSAASSAEALLRSFPSVKVVLMVGIACAVPNPKSAAEHVRLGDIVVSDRRGVVQFDHLTRHDGAVSLRDALPPPSAAFTGALNRLEAASFEGDRKWEQHLDHVVSTLPLFRRPRQADRLLNATGVPIRHPRDSARQGDRPRLFRGVIGSSNMLVKDAKFRDWLRDAYDVRAIEMEGSGIAESAWQHEQHYFVIRGTCDYGDRSKNNDWHYYAAAVAAAFMRSLIEEVIV